MRTSQFLLATLKETPADAEIVSQKLMLRAGLIRKLSAGLYTWLPLGLKVLKKVEAIVREEMNKIGALEILMPAIQPAELWEETGRWGKFGPLLLKIKDRNERDFCFGPTHEEVITDMARKEIRSYKQLPLTFYQIQTKFRDEIRPRFGVMRAREFIMKDAYSFHTNSESLQETYDAMYQAYCRIFTRLGLHFRPVLADTGNIGGSYSHEFQVLADTGEDEIIYSTDSDYAANIEFATALFKETPRIQSSNPLSKRYTPQQKSIEEISAFLNINPQHCIKTLIVKGTDTPFVALLLRGDHELNSVKAEKLVEVFSPLTFASEEDIKQHLKCEAGFVGPIGLSIPIIADRETHVLIDFVCGANETDYHFTHVNWNRDLPEPIIADLRNVVEGDLSPDGKGILKKTRGIEVGHIFQLGKKYSQDMTAHFIDEKGQSLPMEMGCYGLGVSRVVAAAIEQRHDEQGIIWTDSMAPFDIALIPINMAKSPTLRTAIEAWYNQLTQIGYEVLFDDRDERPGVMFSEMDLIGIPHRLVLSDKGLEKGIMEYKKRGEKESSEIGLNDLLSFLEKNIKNKNVEG